MMKEEFEQRIGKTISNGDYKIIETVYTFHPSIDNVRGKDQIVELYKIGGMRIMRDMIPTAEKAKSLDENITALRTKMEERMAEYEALKRGDEF